MILVVGATGQLGREVCKRLSERDLKVKAMVRTTSKQETIDELNHLDIELFVGDLRDTSSYIDELFNVTTIISTLSSMPYSYEEGKNDIETVDKNGIMSLINVAENEGVNHFIYTSMSGNINIKFPLSNAKRGIEKHLKKSSINSTILRPSYFTEVWLTSAVGFDVAKRKVNIYGNGDKPVSYISYKDVAKFITECFDRPITFNRIFELGGPQRISQLDAVKIFEDNLNEQFKLQNVSVKTLQLQKEQSVDQMQKSFMGLMESIAQGDVIDMTETLRVFPIKLTSVSDYVKKVVLPIEQKI